MDGWILAAEADKAHKYLHAFYLHGTRDFSVYWLTEELAGSSVWAVRSTLHAFCRHCTRRFSACRLTEDLTGSTV